ncbi:AbrB/MazE/SpoVT family DNA-binding domain-containing protein [Opitutaceae bacterium TAV4]|uniref:AbrB/MazE/SpoVT family DNA-binding domain-containing protein n=1 Tax=Geminisphaera colitermitum TaxID=1148786 RepID=UPI000158D2A7|nr:AbrB/MazE/SpoVT family DNA-binding domain-containing protein [Geminisphaera colitermitum]RRJ96473.1 AbrB/MazE/SpoVT family DNA-binding domain-containing protein [Opitutaceae bacterium TAV4]RRJ99814.1 AbrB/MazE/SpoVT family DNA-binding domain-containing protein [Opitutaceae bacterium TAV3]
MKLTVKGQVTIPLKLRERYGIRPNGEVVFEAAKDGVLIRPAEGERMQRLRNALRRTRGGATAGLKTADIMRQTRAED